VNDEVAISVKTISVNDHYISRFGPYNKCWHSVEQVSQARALHIIHEISKHTIHVMTESP